MYAMKSYTYVQLIFESYILVDYDQNLFVFSTTSLKSDKTIYMLALVSVSLQHEFECVREYISKCECLCIECSADRTKKSCSAVFRDYFAVEF